MFGLLSERRLLVSISRGYDFAEERFTDGYDWLEDRENTSRFGECGYASSWERAAEEAVMKCLEILS